MNELIKINNQDLEVKECQGKRVVSLKDVDELHERVEGTAGRNFRENKKHFIKGEDYFQRNSSEAKQEFDIIAPNGLILLTESGYLMLVKSLQDDLAWKVQRDLVNKYFKAQEIFGSLSKELKAIFVLDQKTQQIENRINDLEDNMPLFSVDCDELQAQVRKMGVAVLGGKNSPAYNDNSVRQKLYTDIHHQLRREFGVNRYKAIRRCQLNKALETVSNYKVPLVLSEEIQQLNNQIRF